MIRKLALFLPAFCSLLLLSACKQNSTVYGTDTRNYTGQVSSTFPNTYSGQVIDGPMAKARVWLDINGNGLYDKNVSVTVGSGSSKKTLSIPGGEPTAVTDSNGDFTLDVSSLKFNPDVSSDLDPRKYPLMAAVIPDKTVDQSGDGTPEKHAYLMMSPPGQHVISPLTTYVEATSKYCQSTATESCAQSVANIQNTLGVSINLESNYIKANDSVSAAYARAFGYFLGLETPSTYNKSIAGTDGLGNVIGADAQRIIGTVFVKQGPKLIQLVNQAAKTGSGYNGLDVSQIGIHAVPVDISDPEVLYKQTVYLDGATQPKLHTSVDLSNSSKYISSILTWSYSAAGQVLKISADGYMDPSFISLSKLADADGVVGDMESPGLLWFFDKFNPNQANTAVVGDGKADEVLVFDWANNKAYYYSDYSGHGATTSALGDTGNPADAQDVFTWQYDIYHHVTKVSDNNYTMTISYAGGGSSIVTSYVITQNGNGNVLRSWTFGIGTHCSSTSSSPIDSFDVPATVFDNVNSANITDSMSWAYDDRAVPSTSNFIGKLLRLGFVDQNLTPSSSNNRFEWRYGYQSNSTSSSQPYLIQEAVLSSYQSGLSCGGSAALFSSYDIYSYVRYSYERLSKYVNDYYVPE